MLAVPIILLKAQSAVLATGANATGSNGSVSYSVGLPAYIVKEATTRLWKAFNTPTKS
ncbi:hypothetical protein [Chryseobacterium wanjuense]